MFWLAGYLSGRKTRDGFDGVGWLAAIIIGGIAGWLDGRFTNNSSGVVMNIIPGIVGAIVASLVFGLLGISFGGWFGYLIAGADRRLHPYCHRQSGIEPANPARRRLGPSDGLHARSPVRSGRTRASAWRSPATHARHPALPALPPAINWR